MSQLIVFKLGGSSMSSLASLNRFVARLDTYRHRPVLVVVSALSKITDQLVKLADAVRDEHGEEQRQITQAMRARHLQFITQLLDIGHAPAAAERVVAIIGELERTITRLPVGAAFGARQRDRILCFGEQISSAILTHLLLANGYDAETIDARGLIVTDQHFGEAEPHAEQTQTRLKNQLVPRLLPGRVVVTQGFCGCTAGGEVTTLGRGGSDFTATWLAAQLGAAEVEIRTDTRGVLSADPRLVSHAHTLPGICYPRASTLARFGAKVLHHRSVEPLLHTDIALRVCSSFDPDDPGTSICSQDHPDTFSVTGTEGYLTLLTRNDTQTISEFAGNIFYLTVNLSRELLAYQVLDDEAYLVTTSIPTKLPDANPRQVGLLYVLLRNAAALLGPCREALQKASIPIHTAFVDQDQFGLVIATAAESCKRAIPILHQEAAQAQLAAV